jgi:hypothetical protein
VVVGTEGANEAPLRGDGRNQSGRRLFLLRLRVPLLLCGYQTWSHADLSKLTIDQAKEEFEKGASAVRAALGEPGAPFFRFPELRQTRRMMVPRRP